jgi:hypothetical protein
MEFTLHYRGELKGNRGSKDKQALRRHFHAQLKTLWTQLPLKELHKFIDETPGSHASIIKSKHGFKFVPLICEKLNLVAELKITMLRPEPPGAIITQSGDIDNRLKTLFDALKLPSEPNSIPKDDCPREGEHLFFCLLEDDNLITKVNVETDRLLEPVASQSEVVLLVHVTTKVTRTSYENLSFG